MATVLPPPSKRQKTRDALRAKEQIQDEIIPEGLQRIQFKDADSGEAQGPIVSVSLADLTPENLSLLLNSLLGRRDIQDRLPYRFYDSLGITDFDQKDIINAHLNGDSSTELVLEVPCRAEAVFRVKAVTRCSATISGHGGAILSAQFAPFSSALLATGSGDNTVRIWDCETGTPKFTLTGHTGWVLAVAWSPDGTRLATGSADKTVRLWNPKTGEADGPPLTGHRDFITSLSWEPFHTQQKGRPRLASASKDGTVRIWDVIGHKCDIDLTRHTKHVTCVKWGGLGKIYTASRDKTIRIWDANTGVSISELKSHAHWVNHLALSTDTALRTAYFDEKGTKGAPATIEEQIQKAKTRFEAAARVNNKSSDQLVERLVSASDDCTVYLWDPTNSNNTQPIKRLFGHQAQVNHVLFSPDGTVIASCGFDNQIKLWSAVDGTFISTLKGHVGHVYQAAFSADSRLLVSGSKDTTLKVWDVKTGKLKENLPGHQAEVYAVDWSPDGERVGSGGADKQVKIWLN